MRISDWSSDVCSSDLDAQAPILRDLPEHGPPLLQLDRVFRSARPDTVDELLDRAIQSDEEHRLLMALAFVRSSELQRSDWAINRIRRLPHHPKPYNRGQALPISEKTLEQTKLATYVHDQGTLET